MDHWYAIRSKPLKERYLHRQLELRDFEAYLPLLRKTPVNPRARRQAPFFPGYLFVQLDIYRVGISIFLRMPYAVGLVCFGGEPAIVPESFIFTLRREMEILNDPDRKGVNRFHPGEAVRIVSGPWDGYDAIFDAQPNQYDRVQVLLEFLSGTCARLELDVHHIEPVSCDQQKY